VADVQLIEDAFDDLERLRGSGRLPVALKKLIQLEKNPMKGKQLARQLSGFRRIRVGDLRIIFQVNHERDTVVIWACGARRDSDCYKRAEERLAALGSDPTAVKLREALNDLLP